MTGETNTIKIGPEAQPAQLIGQVGVGGVVPPAAEALSETTPEEQALLAGEVTKRQPSHLVAGADYIELDNGKMGIYCPYYAGRGRYERAAYLVDKSLRFGLVPATVTREFPIERSGAMEPGSFQEFVAGARDLTKGEVGSQPSDQLYKLGLLYHAIWENDGRLATDSPNGNVLVTDRLYAIDHAQAFDNRIPVTPKEQFDARRYPERWKRGTFIDDSPHMKFYGVPVPETVVAETAGLLKNEGRQQTLLDGLKELIPERDADACLARIRHLATLLTTKGRIDGPEELEDYHPS